MRYPFTLVKIKSKVGTMWHARFWDESLQKYAHSRSTGILVEGKKERRREAEEAAKQLYDKFLEVKSAEPIQFVPQPTNPQPTEILQTLTPQAVPAKSKMNTVADTPLLEYLSDFWTSESEYAQFKRDVKHHALTPYYIEMNHDDVRRHVVPFPYFEGVTLGNLSKGMLKKWMIWLAGRRKTRIKKDGTIIDEGPISGRRANSVLQGVRVAVRWAYDSEEIPADPFHKLGEVDEILKEKGVLTFEERAKLAKLHVTEKNYRSILAMLLGSYCGLRRGEMRGLQWGDIANGLIHVQHNYINGEGVKLPKYNSVRFVPIVSEVQRVLDIARLYAKNIAPTDFVLESPKEKGVPVSNNFFRDRFKIVLEKSAFQ